MSWQKPSTVKCEKCGSYMIEKVRSLYALTRNVDSYAVCQKMQRERDFRGVSVKIRRKI